MLHLLGSFEAPGSFCDKLSGRLKSFVRQDDILQLALLVWVLGLTISTSTRLLDPEFEPDYSTPILVVTGCS